MSALDIQVGGSHYKGLVIQPIELITAMKCSFIQGCIIKYISRYKHKNGVQDIRKCIHYAQLALQLKDRKNCKDKELSYNVNRFILKNKMTILQRRIITQALYNDYIKCIQYCKELLRIEYPDEIC